MYKRYSRNYRPSYRRRSEGGGWKTFCILGTLIGVVLMCNFFFPAEIQSIRERVTSGWGEIDYRAAFAAIGRAVSGEEKPSEALDEVRSSFSNQTGEAEAAMTEKAASPSEPALKGTGEAAFALLKQGLKKPRETPKNYSEAEPDPSESMLTFDYAEIITGNAKEAVTAFDDGIVTADGESSLYGKYLIIIHGSVTAQYFHCSELNVRSGDEVKKGQIIGYAEPPGAERV